jgi:hypothetical protein
MPVNMQSFAGFLDVIFGMVERKIEKSLFVIFVILIL